ncbi:hypothetical protein [Mycobacteroides abscessus]|uniref:hypothetical protein n=1 Tax=Mycobacteroides abscessus TaxID=36809 RepID=UPI00104265C5|nr:hypothetical protein [Mycobacteroides abscessus]
MTAAQIVIAVATLIVSIITALMVYSSTSGATAQREQQARREQWWVRFEFAMTLALDSEQTRKQRVGFRAIQVLANSPLAGPDELVVVNAVVDALAYGTDNGVTRQEVDS